jgi:hypothetical protein
VSRLLFLGDSIPNNASLWWKDIVRLNEFGGQSWFSSEIRRKMGNGSKKSFWNVRWRGDLCFRLKYPRLFKISNQKEATIGALLSLNGTNVEWNLVWRRNFFV